MNAESKGQAVIAAAQSSSVKGDLSGNVRRHCDFVRRAAEHNVELIVFPELSLTGYEPSVAAELATDLHDAHWEPLKSLADESGMTIVAGCPITSGERRPYIGEVIFGPAGNTVYRKQFVHGTEDEHFVASDDVVVVSSRNCQAAMAICADIENAQHPRDALRGMLLAPGQRLRGLRESDTVEDEVHVLLPPLWALARVLLHECLALRELL